MNFKIKKLYVIIKYEDGGFMIKNIVFDIGNVILDGDKLSIIRKFIKDEDDVKTINDLFFNKTVMSKLEYGYCSFDDIYNSVENEVPSHLKEISKKIFFNYFKYSDANKDIVSLMVKLKKAKYNIYVLSNNNNGIYDYLSSGDLNKIVNGWIVSSIYHAVKPNKDIYNVLFKKYNLKPKECFFIDDKFNNIITGRKFGMEGYVLDYKKDGINKLLNVLIQNGINIEL